MKKMYFKQNMPLLFFTKSNLTTRCLPSNQLKLNVAKIEIIYTLHLCYFTFHGKKLPWPSLLNKLDVVFS